MKRISFFALFALLLLIVPAAHAQEVQPQVTDANWVASYWNNTTLSGNPVLTRQEAEVNFASWGNVAPGVPADNFSARFEKYIDVTQGTYRFRVTVDDGVRLYVDGQRILDRWIDQASTTYEVDTSLSTGYHYVVVEYYEKTQYAQLQLTWGPRGPAPTPGPWLAEYWTNTTLSGNPAVSTTAADVNFDWGYGAPIAGIGADNFSARFTRTVNFQPGTYRFTATSDDGVRVYVAGRPVIDEWRRQAARTFSYDIYLTGGNTEVRVEYFEATERALVKVNWAPVTGSPPPAPAPSPGEVVVDDTSAGFVTGGSPTGFRTENEGWNGRLTWTRNNDVRRDNYNWARWYPSLAPGRYEVFAYIPERYTTTTNATYWVSHRDGFTSVRVNQNATGSQWVSLGTYTFVGNSSDYVSLNDITGEPRLSRLIAFDAVKWVPR